MTRSTPALRPAPSLALLVLALTLATVGCGAGGDDAAAPTTIPAATDATLPSASTGTPGTTGGTVAPITALTVVTVPPATPRSTSTTRLPSTTASTATSGSATTAVPASQRLVGTVTASPSCAVERPDQPCPPRPVATAHIEVFDRAEHLMTSIDADAEGRFSLTLAPGRYVLTASSGTIFPSCPPFAVEVPTTGEARADILCDSGIR